MTSIIEICHSILKCLIRHTQTIERLKSWLEHAVLGTWYITLMTELLHRRDWSFSNIWSRNMFRKPMVWKKSWIIHFMVSSNGSLIPKLKLNFKMKKLITYLKGRRILATKCFRKDLIQIMLSWTNRDFRKNMGIYLMHQNQGKLDPKVQDLPILKYSWNSLRAMKEVRHHPKL